VQHKILKQGKEFFNWLESAAHVYVCGGKPIVMTRNRHDSVIEQFGNKSADQAASLHKLFKEEGRYQKDVY